MILRATFENIYSFKEETMISFVAGKSSVHPDHVSRARKRDDISTLKFGVIYGANASGKSNVIKGIALIQQLAVGRFPIGDFEPFKLSTQIKPVSKIEIEFKTAGKYYAYGVEFSINGIREEWLYEINARTDKLIFTRKTDESGNAFEFGDIHGDSSTSQFVKFLGEGTPIRKTFLSEYMERNGKGICAIKAAYNWFSSGLRIIFPSTRFRGISFNAEQDENFHEATRSLLQYFNTGIVDIRRFPVRSKEETNLPETLLDKIISSATPGRTALVAAPESNECFFFDFKEDGTYIISKQKAVHRNEAQDEVVFEMDEESDGSIRLLDFIPMLIDLGNNEVDYLIDELDRSMHPLLSQKLIECYLHDLSDRDTQLIISTHECNLLNLDMIRADEVWFAEKDKDGASRLVSLAEYKPRENVQKGYLQGRYSAIPFFAPIETLNWQKNEKA
ncbi:MAG: ATP-binding protein [Muribaculaceae bacterium]|nr:ATP-binding protein [Muribaculaceae bacterium]